MAFYDWNRDGKKDFADDYIEYNIYKECTKDKDNDDLFGSNDEFDEDDFFNDMDEE